MPTVLAGALVIAGCAGRQSGDYAAQDAFARYAREKYRLSVGPPSDALRARLEAVAQAFRERDARPVAERWVGFLPPNGAGVMRVSSQRDTCVGFVAIGRDSVGDVNLRVHNRAGIRVAEDSRGNGHPYARACMRAGDSLYVLARAVRGAGEVGILTLANPPLVPPNLDAIVGQRVNASFATPRSPRVAIGTDPAVRDAQHALDGIVRRLAMLGYRRAGVTYGGRLEMQRHEDREIHLDAGTCYAITAAGGEGVEDLDLELFATDGRSQARDRTTDSHPTLKVCPRESAPYRVRVQMYAGAGVWSMAVLAMDPAIALSDDVVGLERAYAFELAADGRRHGMTLMAQPIRAVVAASLPLAIPVTLRSGRCYLLGAAASEAVGGIELSFIDDRGAVLASDTGQNPSARVYHCPHRTMRARVEVRGVNGRGEYLFLVLEGRGGMP